MAVRTSSKTLMFMAADIAHSTAFKETRYGTSDELGWLTPFETFFREMPLVLVGQLGQAFQDADELPEVQVWRVSGDEMVFVAEPRTADEASKLLIGFYRTVFNYHARFSERWPLGLRGCCWAARFPGRNIEVEIPEMGVAAREGGATYLEYLGPDVDSGFRIAGHADPGHVIVSLNLAESVARLPDQKGLQFHFVGREVLKGVYAGRPYPLILVTLTDAMPELWHWELEESRQVRTLRDEPPMTAEALIELADRIRAYLNKVGQLGLSPLEF